MLSEVKYNAYVEILKEELKPAMGCTEPIAIAYAGAIAKKTLGGLPERVVLEVSGNIIKNTKSVVVPHTGGMRGIPAAAAIGIVAGDADAELEVISNVSDAQIEEAQKILKDIPFTVEFAKSEHIFDIMVHLYKGEDYACVRIVKFHTNVVLIQKNDSKILEVEIEEHVEESSTDRSLLSIEDIFEFADQVNIEDVRDVIGRQIAYNMAIAEEGILGDYGANIGKVMLKTYGEDDIKIYAKAKAAAASDARMNGCELPVVINSGSGNQGITASIPVIEYAKKLGVSEDKMYRALVISNLTTIHLKSGIGRLSAYCGAVSAGCGSGAGISYLYGGGFTEGAHTLVNGLAITSGIICDGAKASCAAKIAASVDAGILGYHMYNEGQQFYGGDGIVKKGVENTIKSIGQLAAVGMLETDREIVRIMINEECTY